MMGRVGQQGPDPRWGIRQLHARRDQRARAVLHGMAHRMLKVVLKMGGEARRGDERKSLGAPAGAGQACGVQRDQL